MKRRLLAVSLLAIVLVVLLKGGQITAGILNQKLAPLLTEALGLPVTLAPIKVNLLNLSASTDKLVMGDSKNPAVVASKVWVRIGWARLLRGEVRLVNVKAADLAVKVDSWPTNSDPWPTDYFFLDQWIPKKLEVATGRYIYPDNTTYPLKTLRWKRTPGGGSQVSWAEQRLAGEIAVSVKLHSLKDLLALSDLKADIGVSSASSASSGLTIGLSIQDAANAGYTLKASAASANSKLQLAAGNTRTWEWPDHSKTTIDQISLESIGRLLGLLARENTQITAAELLVAQLPQFEPIVHRGQIEIAKFSVGDESVRNSLLKFSSDPQSINISSLKSAFPRGDLEATSKLTMSPQGWQLDTSAKLIARKDDVGIGAQYLDNDWLWHKGRATLSGHGKTWGGLLDSFSGDIKLAGWHRGKTETPVTITGLLNTDAAEFAIESLDIQLGEAKILGSAAFTGGKERKLQLQLAAQALDLQFLFADETTAPAPGVAIPEYLAGLPGIDLNWDIKLQNLDMPGLQLSEAHFQLSREGESGKLLADITGASAGSMGVNLAWGDPNSAKLTDVTMAIALKDMDLRRTFDQRTGALESRSTGKFLFKSSGDGVASLFKSMRGTTELTIAVRSDGDWTRPARENEALKLSGAPALIIDGKRITGVEISDLNIDSISQDLTGKVSLASNRSPWLIAELKSEHINISELLEYVPETPEQADEADILEFLRKFGTVRVSLGVDTLDWDEIKITDVALEVESDVDSFSFSKLDFRLPQGAFKSRAGLTWKGRQATLESSGSISKLGLDEFVHVSSESKSVPLVGSFTVQAEGEKFAELAAHLSGSASLKAAPGVDTTSPGQRRDLEMKIKRLSDGVEVELGKFVWGETDLQASVRYRNTTPPHFAIDIHGGTLSLLPWEQPKPAAGDKKDGEQAGVLATTAKTSSNVIGRILSAPSRMLSGDESTEKSERYFSDQSMNISVLKNYDFTAKGELASVQSIVGEVKDLKFHSSVDTGKLELDASIGAINSGSIEMKVNYDASLPVPTGSVTSSFKNIYNTPELDTYPRSGFIDLTSSGASQAELAANLNGLAYLELGKGLLDYQGLAFLTSDVASGVFGALIPGAERRTPEIRCGVTLGQFKDGLGVTPYGYAIRTRRANLIGRIDVDFHKERIELQFDSRSRKGAGLSVGNVFSNTVRLQGPLTNPSIVPNTTGLLWRGWAAVMTAGISVVGESVLKRALVAETPCENIRKEIQESMCSGEDPAITSPMVCSNPA